MKKATSHFDSLHPGGKIESLAKPWFEDDTVDAWRKLRMYEAPNPILELDKGAK
ncbi:hypothetical protein [Desulfobulbus alkaliphilus]|uniref:hypothetical protein n=1 Tax=Desulfobulbus alkaliphilus TaxID=869814 RepID=UPI0019649C95|nr:hypothetical protein [Desulfobulbus alkaliphilus]MBM9538343.1 hypothetical protein [Desulfobulbus alkaliphilus]